jgi:hypothetical protein
MRTSLNALTVSGNTECGTSDAVADSTSTARPASSVAERLAAAVDGRTSAVLASSVLFGNAHVVPGLGGVLDTCRREW